MTVVVAEDRLTLAEVLAITGMSRRQHTYWVQQGWLCPVGRGGSGSRWLWPDEELEAARRMVRMARSGVAPDAAAHAARNGGVLPGGLRVLLDEPAVTL